MSNLVSHAKAEFLASGYTPISESADSMDTMIQKNVLELMEVFAKQGHSGSSAPIVVHLFQRLAMFMPLTPLKLDDSEFIEVGTNTFQNIRLGSVFKEGHDGKPYYLDAIAWKTQTGSTWTGSAYRADGTRVFSRQICKSPFDPKTFTIDVIEEEVAPDDWMFRIKDEEQLKAVFEYYEKPE